jgi:hypothetical protein
MKKFWQNRRFPQEFYNKLMGYRFEFRHLTLLLFGLIAFQIILSLVQKSSLNNFLEDAQKWYQKDSAERLANLTATSLELIIENTKSNSNLSDIEKKRVIQSFNIIFSQQVLQHNVEEICLLFRKNGKIIAIDNGQTLYDFLFNKDLDVNGDNYEFRNAINLYKEKEDTLIASEQTYSSLENNQTFKIMVPFVPHGEYLGVLYMKNKPDFSFFTKEIASSYNEASVVYSSLIFLGLLAMYFISSYTVKERDKTQNLLLKEHEQLIKEQIIHEKESVFTKRIYHTHHKAEKVMGFIKDDLRKISHQNIEEVKNRIVKYANFISRVIYDMKWYDPPNNAIRSAMFSTDVNSVIRFIVEHIFLRLSSKAEMFEFKLELSEKFPKVNVNEFVIWEILEPIIQNCIDHADVNKVIITIKTFFDESKGKNKIIVADNGLGIPPGLLEADKQGLKKIFIERDTNRLNCNDNGSSQILHKINHGYGCCIAYELSKKCGWVIDAYNCEEGGSIFEITV